MGGGNNNKKKKKSSGSSTDDKSGGDDVDKTILSSDSLHSSIKINLQELTNKVSSLIDLHNQFLESNQLLVDTSEKLIPPTQSTSISPTFPMLTQTVGNQNTSNNNNHHSYDHSNLLAFTIDQDDDQDIGFE
ncbi:hypothetical protein CYY_009717 [Polysphondylium violaceum]|uniref:Uncharacterized protein n=1 Tax=Polysphondylium violaceum TaxID=133409 RepID=A0A8J4PME8_9MYCE|nr:hypothetical protein CYY_009717 [Polysphondylium violaceum]